MKNVDYIRKQLQELKEAQERLQAEAGLDFTANDRLIEETKDLLEKLSS